MHFCELIVQKDYTFGIHNMQFSISRLHPLPHFHIATAAPHAVAWEPPCIFSGFSVACHFPGMCAAFSPASGMLAAIMRTSAPAGDWNTRSPNIPITAYTWSKMSAMRCS